MKMHVFPQIAPRVSTLVINCIQPKIITELFTITNQLSDSIANKASVDLI